MSHDDEHSDLRGPAKWFTLPGRVLFAFTFLLAAARFGIYLYRTLDTMPPARYPSFMWAAPIAIAAFFFFKITAFFLERAGIRIYRRSGE